ncbi:MAG TPA: hypothetical protein PK159_14635 [Steroidobacteraceae bacterium]|nr:hypothetical protein [Steroidobacteraceae bacterium]
MRERLCLALMPMVGPYTQERPRRPKGGPDGGRDIEAVRDGSIVVWGAVGFQNGGGADAQARNDASKKFRSDLERAVKENSNLQAFIFFTNVDLTPKVIGDLKDFAATRGVGLVDIVDFERLRHALDSPEGLIARLQYLGIPMSPTEQIALVSKFGSQLQNAVSARFDRVENTLSEMERFLAFQKPIHRLDVFVLLKSEMCSASIGEEGLLLTMGGIQARSSYLNLLLWNKVDDKLARDRIVTQSRLWLLEEEGKMVNFANSASASKSVIVAYCEVHFSYFGRPASLADLAEVAITVHLTEGLKEQVHSIAVDANGYEIFRIDVESIVKEASVKLTQDVFEPSKSAKWFEVAVDRRRNLQFERLNFSGRMAPLQKSSN